MVALSPEFRKSNSLATGYAGALVTVFIWATWIIATRHSSGTHLGSILASSATVFRHWSSHRCG
jgi:hypothetical protein